MRAADAREERKGPRDARSRYRSLRRAAGEDLPWRDCDIANDIELRATIEWTGSLTGWLYAVQYLRTSHQRRSGRRSAAVQRLVEIKQQQQQWSEANPARRAYPAVAKAA